MPGGDHAASDSVPGGAFCCCRWCAGATRTRSGWRSSGRASHGCSAASRARAAHGRTVTACGGIAFCAAAYCCPADCATHGRTAFGTASASERSACCDASGDPAAHTAFCATAARRSATPAAARFRAARSRCSRCPRPRLAPGSSRRTQSRAPSHTVWTTARTATPCATTRIAGGRSECRGAGAGIGPTWASWRAYWCRGPGDS